jgi:hypothetical protein
MVHETNRPRDEDLDSCCTHSLSVCLLMVLRQLTLPRIEALSRLTYDLRP